MGMGFGYTAENFSNVNGGMSDQDTQNAAVGERSSTGSVND